MSGQHHGHRGAGQGRANDRTDGSVHVSPPVVFVS
jgi:hypothetical protein